ncbi:MAG: hypothetical protein ABR953_08775 [Candidatus Acidiferrales bacterium]
MASTGQRGICSDETGVIRYDAIGTPTYVVSASQVGCTDTTILGQ